jgi:hypothetical protein
MFKAFATSLIPSYFFINFPSSLNTKMAFLICFWDFIFSIKSEYSGEGNTIKGLSPSLKGLRLIYQEERNIASSFIAIFKEGFVEERFKSLESQVIEGIITSNLLNSS